MNIEKGVLLINLGSPKSTKHKDVRSYLREFLMDKRVIDIPYLSRFFLINFIIVPFRTKKSAAAYKKVWLKEGSPLIEISKKVFQKVADKLDIPVALSMRYSEPSIENGFEELHQKGVKKIFVLPLYPQYAMSSTETVIEKCKEIALKYNDIEVVYDMPFYNDPEYIKALAHSIQKNLPPEFDTLLFSYHGIPERHIYKTDKHNTCKIGNCCFKEDSPSHTTCYRHQCYKTTELVNDKLQLPKNKIYQSFQSRLGNNPWLQPFTDKVFEDFPAKGKKKIAVVCPAFVSDCLETLEEINMEGRHEFLSHGGEEFTYIPCLNDDQAFIQFLFNRIKNSF